MSIVIQSACNKSTEINYDAAWLQCLPTTLLNPAIIYLLVRHFYLQLVFWWWFRSEYCRWIWNVCMSAPLSMGANGDQIATLCNILNSIQKTLWATMRLPIHPSPNHCVSEWVCKLKCLIVILLLYAALSECRMTGKMNENLIKSDIFSLLLRTLETLQM